MKNLGWYDISIVLEIWNCRYIVPTDFHGNSEFSWFKGGARCGGQRRKSLRSCTPRRGAKLRSRRSGSRLRSALSRNGESYFLKNYIESPVIWGLQVSSTDRRLAGFVING